MGQDKDILLLTGGMDRDSDDRAIADGDYRDALNRHIAITINEHQGGSENVRGTLKVNNPVLPPTGVNKTLGSLEDNKDNSIIYLNYNSLGYHGIYRYYRGKGPGGAIEPLLQIKNPASYTLVDNPLNFDPDHFITGVDLIDDKFYWTDNHSRPRKINTLKANNTAKKKSWRVYFNPDGFGTGNLTDFRVFDASNILLCNFIFTHTADTLQSMIDDFMDAYHASTLSAETFFASGCQGYVEITMTSEGDFFPDSRTVVGTDQFANPVVPYNFYPDQIFPGSYSPFPADFIDAIKYPPACQPSVVYKTDTTRNVNLVREKMLQFRCQYIYDDYEKSVWGAISEIAIPASSCDTSIPGLSDNYIEIDFTDPRLNDISLMSIIRRVNIAMREHNEGEWKMVDTLEPYQWGFGKNIYRFFNDKVYQSLDQGEVILPYHSLPPLAKAQKIIDNRILYGGITEGYNKTCVDATIKIDYTPNIKPKTYTIRGTVFIRKLCQRTEGTSNPITALYQPIYCRSTNPDVVIFGGAGGIPPIPAFETENLVLNSTDQGLPLQGFVMYLAGTPFYAVSQQYNLGNTGPGQQYGTGNYFTANSNLDRIVILLSMGAPIAFSADPWGVGNRPNPINDPGNDRYIGVAPGENPTGVFSTFEIRNVPEGTYVLRVGDHRTSQTELNSLDLSWQARSTNVIECGGAKDTECVVEVSAATAVGGYVYVGRSAIADLSNTIAACGYIAEGDGTALTYANILAQERIERAMVLFSGFPIVGSDTYLLHNTTAPAYNPILFNGWLAGEGFTDHNGYYFIATIAAAGPIDLTLIEGHSGQYLVSTNAAGFIAQTVTSANGPYVPQPAPILILYGHRNTNATLTADGRTHIIGTVVDGTGAGIGGVNIVNTHTGSKNTSESDFNGGNFSITVYADTYRFINGLGTTRADIVIASTKSIQCIVTIADPTFSYVITIANVVTTSPPYDIDHPFNIGSFTVIIISSSIGIVGWKHGSDIQYGLVYLDEADRRTAVCTSDELSKHIAFYTEKDPATGALAAPGLPVLSWSIFHEPPSWATKYQWVRTKNLQLNYYLQWAADFIFYTNDDGTATTPISATQIRIGTKNFAKYTQLHPNSTINYNFQKGDRVRFISNAAGTYFQNYYDYEIIDANTTNDYIIIENDVNLPVLGIGTIYEIYTPRLQSNTNLFYEFGECYEIKTAVINGIIKKYHAGPTQEQTYGTLPFQIVTPATGTFTTGNAYYRQRNIPTNVFTNPSGPYTFVHPLIDDAAVSDFYESDDESIGRTNTDLDTIGRIYRPDAFRMSDPFIQDTKVNGLNAFQPLNQKQLTSNFGLINKFIVISDDVLMVVCDNSKIITMYINKNILRTAAGTTNLLVALTEEVIAQSNILQRTFGSQNAESVVINDEQDVFMWDKNIGVVPRYTGNQLLPISDYKMVKYFSDISDGQLPFPKEQVKTPAVYDRYFDEYVIAFNPIPEFRGDKAKAVLSLVELEPLVDPSDFYHIYVQCQPLGVTLCDFVVTLPSPTWSTDQLIMDAINAGGSGFTATMHPNDETIEVFAPNVDPNFNNNAITVNIIYNFTTYRIFNFPLEGGRS